MTIMGTQTMVADNLDDPAIANSTVATFVDHASKLGSQRLELLHAPLDLCKMSPGDAVHFVTGVL